MLVFKGEQQLEALQSQPEKTKQKKANVDSESEEEPRKRKPKKKQELFDEGNEDGEGSEGDLELQKKLQKSANDLENEPENL